MTPSRTKPHLEIAIALVWKDGRLLVTRRTEGSHLAGYWEFPGGKRVAGESLEACAEREVLEETGVECRAWQRRAPITYEYPERAVELHPVDCEWLSGTARALEVADCRWVPPGELGDYEFPPANVPLVSRLVKERDPGPWP